MTSIRSGVLVLALLTFAGAAQADDGTVFVGKDKHTQISAPEGWQQIKSSSGVSQITIASAESHGYAMLISEPKADFSYKSLQDYSTAIMKIEAKKSPLTDRSVTGPKAVKVNDADAVEYEVVGTLKSGVKVHYRKTFIETANQWNQVMCWATPSHYEENQKAFTAINESLKEVAGDKK